MQTVHWSVTGRCNYRCKHCFMSVPEARCGELSHETVLRSPAKAQNRNRQGSGPELGILGLDGAQRHHLAVVPGEDAVEPRLHVGHATVIDEAHPQAARYAHAQLSELARERVVASQHVDERAARQLSLGRQGRFVGRTHDKLGFELILDLRGGGPASSPDT